MDLVKLSKRLSYILRHNPESVGIQLDEAGWVDVDVLLEALARHGLRVTPQELARVVAENDKQRFSLVDGRIRARQGHTVAVNLGLAARVPPDLLFHGTPERNVPSILRRGLVRGRRHHVHLSADRDTARAVGARRGRPVVFTVAAGRMAADGYPFYLSDNGVWLTEHVPVAYLSR